MNRYKVVTVDEAKVLLEEEHTLLLDVREKDDFDEAHIENAYHLNQENLSLFASGTAKETPMVVICYHGNRSQNIAQYLIVHGFTSVYSVEGGYEKWSK